MNILTRNVPRQYLRNGNLNLTGEGYSSFSYGLSGMTGGYLPALPLEEGGYLVEDPVTFMQKILIQGDTQIEGNTQIDGNLNVYGDSNLKNTNIDGDINLTGTIYVNGEEFKGGDSKGGYSRYNTAYKYASGVDGGAEVVIDMTDSVYAEGTIRIYASYTNEYLENPTTDYSAVYNIFVDKDTYNRATNLATGYGSGVSNTFYKLISGNKIHIYIPIPYGYIKSIGAQFSTFGINKKLAEGSENKVVEIKRVHSDESFLEWDGYQEIGLYNSESEIKDMQDKVDAMLKELGWIIFEPDRKGKYWKYIIINLGNFGAGYYRDPYNDTSTHYGLIYGEVQILSDDVYETCSLSIPYITEEGDSNYDMYRWRRFIPGQPTVVGGYYDWGILEKINYNDSGIYNITGTNVAVYFTDDTRARRIRVRFYDIEDVHKMTESKYNIVEDICTSTLEGLDETDPLYYHYITREFSYNPKYLTNYKGDLNVYGNSVLSNYFEGYGGTIIDTHYETFGGSSGNAPQYGIQLESYGYGYSTGSKSYITIQGNTGIQMGCGDFSLSSEGGHTLSSDYWDGYQIDGARISTHNDTFTKEETYSKAQLNTWKDETEWYLNNRVDSWCVPFTERLNNMETQLDNIEILLDSILGYQTNTYLEETLDEILYQ